METLVLLVDTIALMVVLYFSYRSEHTPGQPELGPFRIRAPKAEADTAAATVPARVARRR